MVSDVTTRLVTIHTKCPVCGVSDDIKIPQQGFEDYFGKGMHIQKALPDLTADQREKIITGTCDSCWKEMFKDIEE